jgi:hypothetical protein
MRLKGLGGIDVWGVVDPADGVVAAEAIGCRRLMPVSGEVDRS